MIYNEETENLLRQRGLKCICQLCDCGRPHRHKGCRKPLANVMALSMRSSNSGKQLMVSDYQSKFREFQSVKPMAPIRPIQKPKDPHPPAMDLRTENQESYKIFDNIERSKPCKLKGEIEDLLTGEFTGRSVYNDSYPVHQTQQLQSLRPSTVIKPRSNNFRSETEYVNNYEKKEKIEQECFNEGPVLAYGLLYPDNNIMPKKSLKNLIHDGRKGEKAESCIPRKDHVQLGTDGSFKNVSTTNQMHFKPYEISPVKSMKPQYHIRQRGRFTAVSQNNLDFKYDESEAKKAKGSLCEEYPSLIKLSMDAPVDFKTINRMSYNSLPMSQTKSAKKIMEYSAPTEKFDATTTNNTDFKSFGATRRVEMIKQPLQRKSSAKIEGDSSYTSQFKHHGKVNRILYGDQHEDNLHLPPRAERFTSETVMKSDFRNNRNVEKSKSFKPTYAVHNGGKFNDSTQYSDAFKATDMDTCVFTQYLAEEEARKLLMSTF